LRTTLRDTYQARITDDFLNAKSIVPWRAILKVNIYFGTQPFFSDWSHSLTRTGMARFSKPSNSIRRPMT